MTRIPPPWTAVRGFQNLLINCKRIRVCRIQTAQSVCQANLPSSCPVENPVVTVLTGEVLCGHFKRMGVGVPLVNPHGKNKTLMPLLLPVEQRQDARQEAAHLPMIRMTSRETSDLIMMGI